MVHLIVQGKSCLVRYKEKGDTATMVDCKLADKEGVSGRARLKLQPTGADDLATMSSGGVRLITVSNNTASPTDIVALTKHQHRVAAAAVEDPGGGAV